MVLRARKSADSRGKRKRRIPGWLEFLLLVTLAVLLSIAIKTFLVQMFFVPSESMEPLLRTDDRILVQKVSYWDGEVERGDVVVFEDPGGWLASQPQLSTIQKGLSAIGLYPEGGHLVKRVIGVEGDEVVCCDEQGRITVNAVPLDEEQYLPKGQSPSAQEFRVSVPANRLWVMGDNRANSEDSRFHQDLPGKGTIPVDSVVGKVFAVVWPFGRLDRVEHPEAFDEPKLGGSGG